MRKIRLLTLFFFGISFFLNLNAQIDGVDSLENLLQQHAQKDTIRVILLNEMAYKLYLIDFDKSLEYAEKAGSLADIIDYTKGKAGSLRFKGVYYYMKANYLKSLEYYQKSLKLEEQIENKNGISRCYNNISLIFREQGDYSKALKYSLQSLKFAEEINDKLVISVNLNNIGNIYNLLGNYPKALEYYEKSLKISKTINLKNEIVESYNRIGEVYTIQKNYSQALEYLQKSLKISIKMGYKSMENKTYKALGILFLQQKSSKKAYEYSKKAYLMAKETGELGLQKESSEIVAKSCENLGSYKEAYQYYVIFKTINDSLYNKKNVNNIANLESQYKYEKEKQAIELRQKGRDAVQAENEKRQKVIHNFLILAFFLMAFLALIVFKYFLQKRKANLILAIQKREIEDKNEELFQQNEEIRSQTEEMEVKNNELNELNATKDKFFTIIAHDLKGPFNSILGLSNILEKNYKLLNDEKREEYIKYINVSSTRIYKLLTNLLTWSQAQKGKLKFSPEKICLKETIDEGVLLQFETSKSKRIKIEVNIETRLLAYVDKDMFSTVIRNLVSNAIKFTPIDGKISVNATEIVKENNQAFIKVTVKDTGVGISKEMRLKIFEINENTTTSGTENEPGTGLGLILCKEFVEKHGGKIWVESETGKGSEFIFTIPKDLS